MLDTSTPTFAICFPHLETQGTLTSAVKVRVAGPMPRAQAGGAGVAVLGAGAAGAETPHLAVGAVHHLHKLPAPALMGGKRDKGCVTARVSCTEPAPAPHWASPRNSQKDISDP